MKKEKKTHRKKTNKQTQQSSRDAGDVGPSRGHLWGPPSSVASSVAEFSLSLFSFLSISLLFSLPFFFSFVFQPLFDPSLLTLVVCSHTPPLPSQRLWLAQPRPSPISARRRRAASSLLIAARGSSGDRNGFFHSSFVCNSWLVCVTRDSRRSLDHTTIQKQKTCSISERDVAGFRPPARRSARSISQPKEAGLKELR